MKKDMLFITTQFPYPLDNGGKIGAYNGISVVSKDYNVTVLSFSEEPKLIDKGIEFYKNKFSNVNFITPIIHDIHIRKKALKLCYSILLGYLKKLPYIVSKFYNKNMILTIDKLFENNSYEIIFIDYLNMVVYGDYIKNKYHNKFKNIILKDHNVEYELVKQEYETSSGLKRILLKNEWHRTYKYEKNAIKKYNLIFTVCDENTKTLKTFNQNVYTMFPTYEMLPKKRELANNNNIIYFGNLSWKYNYDGIYWFSKNVMPKIVEKVSDAKLLIAGGGLEDNPFKDFKNVDYLGYVDDLSELYKNGKVFIVPLFEGSGIRIKILEAFNNEIAVVSTTIGCETIGATNDKEIMISDNIDSFVESIVLLLTNIEKNNSIRYNAKKLLKSKFSLTKRQEEFKEIIQEVLGDYNE